MTAPDSPAAAELREWAFSLRASADPEAYAARAVLAELDEARREVVKLRALTDPNQWSDVAERGRDSLAEEISALRHALNAQRDELDEARRRPRVWLEGDEVPAGVLTVDQRGDFDCSSLSGSTTKGPLVEVLLPDYAAAVAAERERRRMALETPAEAPAATESSEAGG